MASDIEMAQKAGCKGATLEIAANPIFVEKAYGKSMDWAKKAAIEATIAAKELGLYVSFFTIDGTRTEIDCLLDIVDEIQSNGHMDAFVMADTFGCVHPQSAFNIVSRVKQRFNNIPVEAHMHMHFGLGAANTLAAIAAGADVAHVAVSGIGEGAGNTPLGRRRPLAEAASTASRRASSPKSSATSASSSARWPTTIRCRRTVRSSAATCSSSSRASASCSSRTPKRTAIAKIMGSYQPEMVGQPGWQFVLGKKSGLFSVERFLRQIGKTLDKEKQSIVLDKIKELSLRERRLITLDEFKKFVAEVGGLTFIDVGWVKRRRRPAICLSMPSIGGSRLRLTHPTSLSRRERLMSAMDHPFVQHLIKLASAANARIAIPDAQFDARFLEAACIVTEKGWLKVGSDRLAGEDRGIGRRSTAGTSAASKSSIPTSATQFDSYCQEYAELRAKDNLTPQQIRDLLHEPIYFACMLHKHGVVDGICSGVHYSTADLARPVDQNPRHEKRLHEDDGDGHRDLRAHADRRQSRLRHRRRHGHSAADVRGTCGDRDSFGRQGEGVSARTRRAWRCFRFRRSAARSTRKSIA